ncbi:hypothetical protein L218DRAFT_952938 [Marasmius fiardii PR-910]|nr:hypothetical protein L218DRAFT_952938 [Marasmius fiardii PR-910]
MIHQYSSKLCDVYDISLRLSIEGATARASHNNNSSTVDRRRCESRAAPEWHLYPTQVNLYFLSPPLPFHPK